MIDIGSVLNAKYRLVRLVGDGGMGSVYEGMHVVLGTRVAIKVLHPDLARRTGLVERFLQEARVAAQIRSAHVVQVTDVDRTPDGHAYIVMELLEGEPLSAVLDRQRRLAVATACEYTLQILEALEAAHALGVIHRDLKPENVFLTFSAGRPVLKLIDFGIAKARPVDARQKSLTVAGVVMGTAEYMAPEQARSADKVDARADIYAVGVMLYEMIAGSRPVKGDDARVIALKVERGEIVPLLQAVPDVPRELAGLVHRAMAPRPEMRFATATEMRLAVEHAATGFRPSTAVRSAGASASLHEAGPNGTHKGGLVQSLGGGLMSASGAMAPAHPPAAQAQTPLGAAESSETGPKTQRAPPLVTALGTPLGASSGAMGFPGPFAVAPPPGRPVRNRRGAVLALVTLAVFLGGGVVAMLVSSGMLSSPEAPLPGNGPAAPVPVAEAAAPAPTPSAIPPPAIPSLSTPKTNQPQPGPLPHPVPSSHPSPGRPSDAGGLPPPFVFPSTLPAIPSILPLPSGFPTSLPSIFPWPGPVPTLSAPPAPAPSAPPAPSRGSTI